MSGREEATYLRDYWYVAAMSGELGRALLQRWVLDEPLLLFRAEDGRPVAMSDVCPHRGMALSKGALIGDTVRCGYHGLVFDREGRCVRAPAQKTPPRRARVATRPAVEKWRWIWVWMGDPAAADETLIPDMRWNDDPAWHPVGDLLTIGCHYQLLADNLLDLSHEAFVHQGTIGNDAVAETPATAKREGRVVTVERLMRGCPAPPLFLRLGGYADRIDRMQRIQFRPPANIVIESRSTPAGAADERDAMRYWVMNAITPETAGSCHHFWAVARGFAPGDEIGRVFYEGSVKTFGEDVEGLETQRRMMERRGGAAEWINVGADAGCVHARRVVAELLAEQNRPPA